MPCRPSACGIDSIFSSTKTRQAGGRVVRSSWLSFSHGYWPADWLRYCCRRFKTTARCTCTRCLRRRVRPLTPPTPSSPKTRCGCAYTVSTARSPGAHSSSRVCRFYTVDLANTCRVAGRKIGGCVDHGVHVRVRKCASTKSVHISFSWLAACPQGCWLGSVCNSVIQPTHICRPHCASLEAQEHHGCQPFVSRQGSTATQGGRGDEAHAFACHKSVQQQQQQQMWAAASGCVSGVVVAHSVLWVVNTLPWPQIRVNVRIQPPICALPANVT
jgi:hypothetical protein